MTIQIIAEAGVNHNGDMKLAIDLIDAAADAGADVVKFQTFKASQLVTASAEQADYQKVNTQKVESQYEMLKRLELKPEAHLPLIEHCKKRNIEFLSTAFDSESLAFLYKELGMKTLKIPSGEITNAPLVLEHAQTGLQLIVSTGMATMKEIEETLGVIAFGLTQGQEQQVSRKAFADAYRSDVGQAALKKHVSLLHCTTEYPAPEKDIHLKAMHLMDKEFGLPIGYSDHSRGIAVSIGAAALGAKIIEKHFTLDKNMPGPDHKASLEPDELKAMVDGIRQIELAVGNEEKKTQASELSNKTIARKSLVAAIDINVGDTITEQMLTVKRPETGKSPYEYWDMIGSKAEKAYKKDDVII